MRKVAFAVVLLAVAIIATSCSGGRSASSSIDYPWCANTGGRDGYENCGYDSLQQCLAAVSGVGGHCNPNARYVPDYPREPLSGRQ